MRDRKPGREALESLGPLLTLLAALGAGVALSGVLALMMGVSPGALFETIWSGAWGEREAASATLSKLTPLLLTGLAVSLAYQGNLLNVGCEGQLTLGALAGASFAVSAAWLPTVVLMPLTILVGAVTGGLWAWPAIWMRQKRGVHEVISTLLLNYVATHLASYLVLGPLGDGSAMGRTPEMPAGAVWPPLWFSDSRDLLTVAPILALFLSFLVHLYLKRTVWGLEATATGANAAAARGAGIRVDRWQMILFTSSGALAGMAGAIEAASVHHRFYRAFSPGYGYDGITVAFLVDTAPGWLWLSGLLLASLRAADKWLQLSLNVSPSIILVIQAILLLSVACQKVFRTGRWIRRSTSAASSDSQP